MTMPHVCGTANLRLDGGCRQTRAPSIAILFVALLLSAPACKAADGWNPFSESSDAYTVTPRRKVPPASPPVDPSEPYGGAANEPLPPLVPGAASVERVELAPIEPPPPPAPAADPGRPEPGLREPSPRQPNQRESGLAGDVYPGPPIPSAPGTGLNPRPGPGLAAQRRAGPPAEPLDEKLAAAVLDAGLMPNLSPALTGLWHTHVGRSGAGTSPSAVASRFEALWRSGFPAEAASVLAELSSDTSPLAAALRARIDIAFGRTEPGCEAVRLVNEKRDALPKSLMPELVLHAGFCAAVAGNPKGAGAIAELAREQKLGDPGTVALLAALAKSSKADLSTSRQVSPLTLRLAQLAKAPLRPEVATLATPAALAILSSENDFPAGTAAAATEQAARLSLVPMGRLAAAYRKAAQAEPSASGGTASRAVRFVAAEAERSPLQRTRLIRAYLDSARRDGIYLQALMVTAPLVDQIRPAQEIGWFAETAIEVLTASGKYDLARRWATFAGLSDQRDTSALRHWLPLIDLADPSVRSGHGAELAAVEMHALNGRFDAAALHRLATVLDALDYNVPMRLWETASRTPQPTTGHLPETGTLKELQDAARNREMQRVALLSIMSIGRTGGEGTNLIALGDTIRAMRRAGLDVEARRVALEILLPHWPRSAN